jgi:Alr-MurF fusion protein
MAQGAILRVIMISLYDILEASNGQLFGEAAAQAFTRFCLAADQAQESDLFVARKGDYGDSHLTIQEAVNNGATGVLCMQPPNFDTNGVSVIVVRDTEQALMDWARFILMESAAISIAVAGTSGRTDAIAAIEAVLGTVYKVCTHRDEHHLGRLGLPLSLAKLETTDDFVIVDMTLDKPGELDYLMDIVQPQVGVITQIGQLYLDRFADVDQVAAEHHPVVSRLREEGLAVLNYDDDRVRELAPKTQAEVTFAGIGNFGADLMAYNVVPGPARTGFDLRYRDRRLVGNWVPLAGANSMYAALLALGVGLHYGLSIDIALRALTTVEPLPGRMSFFVGYNDALIVDDTFDTTPESTLAALDWLASVKDEQTRTVFVFGDIDNLGDHSRTVHREIGRRAVEVADVIVTEGAQAALAGRAAQDFAGGNQQVHVAFSIQDAARTLKTMCDLTRRDIVLVNGGANARMEAIVRALLTETVNNGQLPRPNLAAQALSQPLERPLQPSWVTVDLEALARNVRTLKNLVGNDVTLMATVKADAYGHGAVAVSRVAIQNGAGYLAVASLREALELRNAGITETPILVLSYTPVYGVREALRHDVTVTLYDLDMARAYNKVAAEMKQRLKVHVKVDSGMGRLGILPEGTVEMFRHLLAMPNLDIEGIYTHFSMADVDVDFTEEQYRTFRSVLVPLRAGGIPFKYVHVSNTAGTLLGEKFHHNMVRCGLAMYGYQESKIAPHPPPLNPVMSWRTVIAQVKTLPPGHAVGYGNEYVTHDDEQVAVIPVGYGDGLRRGPHNWGYVLVHGERVPILGRVSMEKTIISVKHLDGVSIGDEVVLLGRQGNAVITAEDVAKRLQTNVYEVLTNILPRVPRY